MKNKIIAFTLFLIPIASFGDTHVNGYERRNGTYVQPYERTSPNDTRVDNYSTKGNFDPYTGNAGTRDPYQNYKEENSGRIYYQSTQNWDGE